MKAEIKKLVSDVTELCLKHNVSLKLSATESVMADSIICSGYFDNDNLVVAAKKKDWVDVFAHESCHMDQYIEKVPIYDKGDDGIQIVDSWLEGKDYSNGKLLEAFKNSILMELDCEKRTVKKLKKYKIQFNEKKYIKQVNSYLFSYWATYRDRKWFPFPYNKPNIYNKLPDRFLSEKVYCDPFISYLKYFPENENRKKA